MTHHGNVTKINGAEVEPVDVITFGAPCQDLSVAGKRSGLKHVALGDDETTRSGLFFEAIRIIKEMREATNNEYPKYAVYENVPGAFSSNKGRDFHAVLEALCSVCDDTVSIPKPYDAKRTKLVWNKAGEIVGDNHSIAWRTLDAQYWGVPQRRKRIYLVADFTGQRAGEILFKSDSRIWDSKESGKAWQEVTADAVGSVDGSVGIGINGDVAGTLDANYFKGCGLRNGVEREVIALQANDIDRADTADRHAECYDARGNGDGETAVICKKPPRRYIIRRLTPTECARLQGFPDDWGHLAPYNPADAEFWEQVRKTHAEINGKKYKPTKNLKKWYEGLHTDSAEYKMWGNGIALPNARHVMQGIAEQGAKTLGSLFDGSGGFPLAGALNGITPLWASEVEPYPIAVTKSRFKEEQNGK